MIRSLKYACLVVFLLLALIPLSEAFAHACAASNGQSLAAEVQSRYRMTRSFDARFEETIEAIGGSIKRRTGHVYYEKPGRIRWDFDLPEKETIIADGHNLYDYQEDLNQVIETPLSKALPSSVVTAFLLGIGDIRRDFVPSLGDGHANENVLLLILKPKPGSDLNQSITLMVDPDSCSIVGIKVNDAIGNKTEVRLHDVRLNVALDSTLFTFKVPTGADLIVTQ